MTLQDLCQIMFDPENQPPQFSNQEAWSHYKRLTCEHEYDCLSFREEYPGAGITTECTKCRATIIANWVAV